MRYTKFLKFLDKLDPGKFFDVVDGATPGHSLKLFKRRVRQDVGKYKFGNRVCNEWNGLSWLAEVVMADSLVTFKAKLDHHLRNVRGLFKQWLFPCLLPSLILQNMLGGNTVNRKTINTSNRRHVCLQILFVS